MWSLLKTVLLSTLVSATTRCPDGSSCLDKSACCKLQAGGYGCCPVGEDGFSSLLKTQAPERKAGAESTQVSSNSSIVPCDQTYFCPDTCECCQSVTGRWTCCPRRLTVCCHGGTMCCRAENTHDIAPSTAALKDRTDPVEGESLPEMEIQSNDISTGPATGDQAKCCKDGGNCCPPGTKCDPQSSLCRMDDVSFPWSVKKPALRKSQALQSCKGSDCSVIHCDDTHVCKAGSSCCKMSNHQWGCCPYPNDGFSSLLKTQAPERKAGAESTQVSSNSSIVPCDQTYFCPDTCECCQSVTGRWTCCPRRLTVCCHGGTMCCRAENTHDIAPSTAALKDRTDPVEGESLPEMEIQSNDISTGPATGDQAKCCKDGGNCCPPGTKCDPQSSLCRMDDVSFPWSVKKPALRKSQALQSCKGSDCSVIHCDDTHVCKAGSSCCKMSNHQWGCCPYPNAHCCWDGKHCCPSYHWCDHKRNLCRRWWPPYEWKQISSIKYDKESENL